MGLLLALAILVAAAAANYAFVGTRLPAYSVTQASFHTWTAQAAYLKGIVYCGIFAGLFLLIPFHFVLAMQRNLWEGAHRIVHETLTAGQFGIPPRGAPYLGVWLLSGLLILGAASSVTVRRIFSRRSRRALQQSLYTDNSYPVVALPVFGSGVLLVVLLSTQ